MIEQARRGDLPCEGTSDHSAVGPGDLRYVKPPDDLIVLPSLLVVAEPFAKAGAPSSTTQPAAAARLRAILFTLFATF